MAKKHTDPEPEVVEPVEEPKPPKSSQQIPTIGRVVLYTLSAQDVDQIMRRRTTRSSIAARQATVAHGVKAWPDGAQAHLGNDVKEGDVFPMLIVRVWGTDPTSSVNGQVFLDGSDILWTTSRSVGTQPGTWVWPTRT